MSEEMSEDPSRRVVLRQVGNLGVAAAAGAIAATLVDDSPPSASENHRLTFVYGGGGRGHYDDWATLVGDLADAPPGDKWIEVGADAVVPAGTWDLRGAGFRGRRATGVGPPPWGNPVILRFADGAVVQNASRHLGRDGIVLWSDSAASVIVVDDERSYYFEDDTWVVSTDAAFFEVTAEGDIPVLFSFRTASGLLHEATTELGDSRQPSIEHTGSAMLLVAMASGNNLFDDDTIAGNDVYIAVFASAAGMRDGLGTRAGFSHRAAASVTPLLFSTAENIRVDPAQPRDWPEQPTDVGHALDLLAARVASLER